MVDVSAVGQPETPLFFGSSKAGLIQAGRCGHQHGDTQVSLREGLSLFQSFSRHERVFLSTHLLFHCNTSMPIGRRDPATTSPPTDMRQITTGHQNVLTGHRWWEQDSSCCCRDLRAARPAADWSQGRLRASETPLSNTSPKGFFSKREVPGSFKTRNHHTQLLK